MANLIPEVRINKNGVAVTKHVKGDATSVAAKSRIPSPGLEAAPAKKKPVKLLPRQTRVNHESVNRFDYPCSDKLAKVLRLTLDHKKYDLDINDKDAYGVFSIMRVGDALRMIHFGYRTKESAQSFLESQGLTSILQDNSDVMREALEDRKIPSSAFAKMDSMYGMNGHPPQRFLDAAEAYSSGTLRGIEKDESASVHVGVLAGEISLQDIKTVGYGKIQHSNAPRHVIAALSAIRAGKLDCTAEDIRHLIDQSDSENNLPDKLVWALNSINKYGVEFLKTLKIHRAFKIDDYLSRKPVEQVKDLMEYDRAMMAEGGQASLSILSRLHREGVDPSVAGRLYKSGMNVEQIVGAHEDDIPTAVTSGWL